MHTLISRLTLACFAIASLMLSSVAITHATVKPSFNQLASNSDLIALAYVSSIDNTNNPDQKITLKVKEILFGNHNKDNPITLHYKLRGSKGEISFKDVKQTGVPYVYFLVANGGGAYNLVDDWFGAEQYSMHTMPELMPAIMQKANKMRQMQIP